MRIYRIIKSLLFVTLGVLLIIFKDFFTQETLLFTFVIAGTMCYYSLEGITILLLKKELKEELAEFVHHIVILLISITMFFVVRGNSDELVISCVLWAVWSIERECFEVANNFKNKENRLSFTLNLVESIVVIALSLTLIATPTIDKANEHLILLAIELILEIVWPISNLIESNIRNKNR